MTQNSYIYIVVLLIFSSAFSQKKTLIAERISEKIIIDGKLDEDSWASAAAGSDFIMLEPDNGKPISPEKKAVVKIIYDDDAIYVSAVMFDDEPKKILKEITQRDNFGTAEHFGVLINGFNDGQQEFQFFLSAAGVQMDCVVTESNGEDFSWDAIWEGNVEITDFGWVAEMKIPYAALRFSSDKKQTWGLNFYREIRRDRQKYTWNYIDTKIGSQLTQSGILEGIENIETPTRLFFIPYASYYNNIDNEGSQSTLKGGLDIKYGINDSFTLDVILIPDFGQTRFDNVELNLGPFEQQFNENRPFFTEGTDLFNKGNLLYSRRIGGSPSIPTDDPNYQYDLPSSVNLLNALKVSGRTKNGLGIGFLNAVTERTLAVRTDLISGEVKDVVVEPLANYNVVVLDQRFNKNSSVSFVNTNVTRNGDFRDANVSAMVFDVNTKANTYKLTGDFKYSFINEYKEIENREGFNTSIYAAETSGNYRFGTGAQYVSKDFDNNDLGINFMTHFYALHANGSYRILNPTGVFNSLQVTSEIYTEFDNATSRMQQGNLAIYSSATSKKNDYYSLNFNFRPLELYDFYEPRIDGRYVYIPRSVNSSFYFSSNYNRKFALDFNPSFTLTEERNREAWGIFIQPIYRFSDKVTANIGFNFLRQNNNTGYVSNIYGTDDIYFAKRNRSTYTLSSYAKYSINKDMTINLNARYYWSFADNREFFTLTDEGYLIPAFYDGNPNSNFNAWNLDLSYSWWFAPGSQASVLYRNNSATFSQLIDRSLGNNFSNLFQDNLTHVFSISIRYFIDYNQAKNWFK